VFCQADPDSQFPKYFSGGVIVKFKDGTTLSHYVPINKGAGERAMSANDIKEKFLANAQLKLTETQAAATLEILQKARGKPVRAVLKDIAATA